MLKAKKKKSSSFQKTTEWAFIKLEWRFFF